MRLILPFGNRLLLTSGRLFTTSFLPMILAFAFKSWPLFYASVGFIATIYGVLTGLMWPQRRITAAEWERLSAPPPPAEGESMPASA